MTTKQISVAP